MCICVTFHPRLFGQFRYVVHVLAVIVVVYSSDYIPFTVCTVFFHLYACHCTISNLLCICAPHSTHLCLSLSSPPPHPSPPHHSFLSYVGQIFFSASATCVVAMFLCLYISEHLLIQQGPHGLKCQSKQLPDKRIVQQACVSPPPVPPLLVM